MEFDRSETSRGGGDYTARSLAGFLQGTLTPWARKKVCNVALRFISLRPDYLLVQDGRLRHSFHQRMIERSRSLPGLKTSWTKRICRTSRITEKSSTAPTRWNWLSDRKLTKRTKTTSACFRLLTPNLSLNVLFQLHGIRPRRHSLPTSPRLRRCTRPQEDGLEIRARNRTPGIVATTTPARSASWCEDWSRRRRRGSEQAHVCVSRYTAYGGSAEDEQSWVGVYGWYESGSGRRKEGWSEYLL